MSPRRHKDTRGANVTRGFRMEPDLASRLIEHAKEVHDGDIAATARRLLRIKLGWDEQQALAAEGEPLPESTRGMKMELNLKTAVERYAARGRLPFVGAVRHILRLALGIDFAESMQREQRFAAIAAARRGLAETYESE